MPKQTGVRWGIPPIGVTVFLLVSLVWLGQRTATAKEYVLAVLPQKPAAAMFASWNPLVVQLSRATGATIRLKVYEEMLEFEGDVSKGVADFIYANPTQTVMARQRQGYIPLVRGSRPLRGALFVRADSPIRTIQDLEGKTVAFVGAKNL